MPQNREGRRTSPQQNRLTMIVNVKTCPFVKTIFIFILQRV